VSPFRRRSAAYVSSEQGQPAEASGRPAILGAVIVVAAASSSSNTLVGIIAGIASGVVVALISAYIQSKNTTRTIKHEKDVLKKTLGADEDRLGATLKAEREQLETQLSFQRGETDRAELRGLLDQLAAHLLALDELSALLKDMVETVLARSADEDEDDEFKELQAGHFSEIGDKLSAASRASGNIIEQLRLRLGGEGTDLMGAAAVVRLSAIGVRRRAVDNEPTREILRLIRDDRRLIETRRPKFTAQAFTFTQARLHRPDQDGGPGSATSQS
jgi:hypothetical protein